MAHGAELPEALIAAVRARRLIPFVGAGFSSLLGIPGWTELLRRISTKLAPDVDFNTLYEGCGRDPLKMAEYLHLLAGSEIGPLRQRISEEISVRDVDPVLSTAHVELVNLGATRIYTTNYDDLLERTFNGLGEPFHVVATARHIARSNEQVTEIVKFHGDVQWESSLVFTESSYFDRLQLETPLDIKLRSDILGNSVLFMGYGFSDVNIRLMWHRLMTMMKGVAASERPQSFIVRLEENPVHDALDAAAGISPIILTSDYGEATDVRLGNFLLRLNEACDMGRPRFASPAFLSGVARVATGRETLTDTEAPAFIDAVARRRIPVGLASAAGECLRETVAHRSDVSERIAAALTASYVGTFGSLDGVLQARTSDEAYSA